MAEFVMIARLLLSPLLLILSTCDIGGISYSSRIGNNGRDVLYSKAHVQDGVARFECKASDSGACHYTLYPDACAGKADCTLAPLQRFSVTRGQTRRIDGLGEFRVCVGIDARARRADCEPVDDAH